jgi:integrase
VAKRGQGEGSIYRRSDGTWEAKVSLGWVNGKRVRRSFYGKTKTEVRERMQAVLRDVRRGLPAPDERLTVGQFLEQWTRGLDERVRPSTARRYRELVRLHLVPEIGDTRLVKLSPQQVQGVLQKSGEKGLSHQTVAHIRAVLRTALAQAQRWELVSRNVAALAGAPRVPDRQVEALTPVDARAILEAVNGSRLDALVTLVLYTGLRQGEALGLRWSDVDVEARALSVRVALQRVFPPQGRSRLELVEPKTRKSRRPVPFPPLVADVLRVQKARQAEDRLGAGPRWMEPIPGLVFTTHHGTPLDGRTVTAQFQAALARAGLARRRFHELRHGCATLLLASGVDLKVVSQLLGHSTIALTANTYTGVLPALQREASDRLAALLAPPSTDRR